MKTASEGHGSAAGRWHTMVGGEAAHVQKVATRVELCRLETAPAAKHAGAPGRPDPNLDREDAR